MSRFQCDGMTKDCPVEHPCSIYTDFHTEQEVLPTVKTCLFWDTIPVQFVKVDNKGNKIGGESGGRSGSLETFNPHRTNPLQRRQP